MHMAANTFYITDTAVDSNEKGRQLLLELTNPTVLVRLGEQMKFAINLPASEQIGDEISVFGAIFMGASVMGLTNATANFRADCHYMGKHYITGMEVAWGRVGWHIVNFFIQDAELKLAGPSFQSNVISPVANAMMVFERVHTKTKKLVNVNMPRGGWTPEMERIFRAWLRRFQAGMASGREYWTGDVDGQMLAQLSQAVAEAAAED